MRRISLMLTLSAVLFVIVTCGDDNPVRPKEAADEHLFYIAPKEGNTIRVFSIEREKFIDSLTIDSVAVDDTLRLHVIGDDSLLAVSTRTETYLVDLATKEVVGSFMASSPTFSRDSRYYYTDGLVKTFPGHAELFHQVGYNIDGRFCNRSEVIAMSYCTDGDTTRFTIYNVLSHSTSYSFRRIGGYYLEPGLPPSGAYPSNTLNKLFLCGLTSFGASDFFSDSIRILKDGLPFGAFGYTHVITPDEKYVVFTDDGYTDFHFGYAPSGCIFVYDAATEDSLATIHLMDFDIADQLIVSSDSKYLVARMMSGEYWGNNFKFCLIDLQESAVVYTYDCGFNIGDITSKYCASNVFNVRLLNL